MYYVALCMMCLLCNTARSFTVSRTGYNSTYCRANMNPGYYCDGKFEHELPKDFSIPDGLFPLLLWGDSLGNQLRFALRCMLGWQPSLGVYPLEPNMGYYLCRKKRLESLGLTRLYPRMLASDFRAVGRTNWSSIVLHPSPLHWASDVMITQIVQLRIAGIWRRPTKVPVEQFEVHIAKVARFLNTTHPGVPIVWVGALPTHFDSEDGIRYKNGTCPYTTPNADEPLDTQTQRLPQLDAAMLRAISPYAMQQAVLPLEQLRSRREAHVANHSINRHGERVWDCTHWCIPGPLTGVIKDVLLKLAAVWHDHYT
eukprot:NODE_1739_length_1233_cov_76.326401_g1724_i0.p1 GENE.NODE_1739_length_1233_cov_76.326401_g1724_i0~~NODE_1739_length_1233_cov_76.326401_g1724_i0.p1  ORF type:complete len:312 (+),score=1.56 NODE_1739_length_1233_cov_76.326401_g1724_i0:115-1050(+)